MKRLWIAALVMALACASAALAPEKGKNQPQSRELTGQVMNQADAPVADAIVYLKNTKTLTIKTFITGPDGKYRFPALAQNVDYEVFAEHQGRKSGTKTLSSFDSRAQANINLKIAQ